MKRCWSLLGVFGIGCALAGAGACAGSETGASGGGGEGGEGGDTSSTSTGPGSGGGAGGQGGGSGGQGGGAGGQGGGAGGQGGSGGQGGGAPGSLVPTLVSLEMYANCQPIVPPDPVIGSFTAGYDNKAAVGSAEAVVTSSKLIFSDAKTWLFKVAPPSSGMLGPMMKATVAHQKQNASGEGTIMPCDYCGQMWTLEVTWDIGGSTVTDTLGPQNVECVF